MDCAILQPHTLAYHAECKSYQASIPLPKPTGHNDIPDDPIPNSINHNTLYNLGQLVVTTVLELFYGPIELPTLDTLLIITFMISLIYPICLLIAKWIQTYGKKLTVLKLIHFIAISYLLHFLIVNIGYDYFWVHIQQLGHPPLYGPHPPMESVTHAWLILTWGDLIAMNITLYIHQEFPISEILLQYLQVIERCITVVYWRNLTCLSRVFMDLLVEYLGAFVSSPIYVVGLKIICNCCVLIHMIFYIFVLSKNGSSTLSEATTVEWFKIPDHYQLFAWYQLIIITLETLLHLSIMKKLHSKQKTD